MMAERHLLRLAQFIGRDAAFLNLLDNFKNQLLSRLAFFGIDSCLNPEHARFAGRIRKRGDAVNESGFLAKTPVESRQLCRKFVMNLTPAKLRRLPRDEDRLERLLRVVLEKL